MNVRNPYGLLLGLWLGLLAQALARPDLAQQDLAIDGVSPGMSYSQVLEVRGRPAGIRAEQGLWQLLFTPRGRRDSCSVWFQDGRVVFASGYDLQQGEDPLFLYGMEGTVLQEAFGEPEPLNVFSRWYPSSGVVLYGFNNRWPLEVVTSPLGLRDPRFPLDWDESEPGVRWSRSEPWVDDEMTLWLADDVELGMVEDRARKLAGGLEVTYSGGFVRAIHHPSEALLSHRVGHHDLSTEFVVGEPPLTMSSTEFPAQGWITPAEGGRIRMENGRVAEIELQLENDALFEALDKTARQP